MIIAGAHGKFIRKIGKKYEVLGYAQSVTQLDSLIHVGILKLIKGYSWRELLGSEFLVLDPKTSDELSRLKVYNITRDLSGSGYLLSEGIKLPYP